MKDEIRDLKICIIGAGMAGLACALSLVKAGFRRIEIYEAAYDLGFVGAGIHLAPNMARILDGLGVWKNIECEAVALEEVSIVQGSTDEELGNVKFRHVKELYDYDHSVGHRSSLAGSMYARCLQEQSIRFNFGHVATKVVCFAPRPKIEVAPRDGRPMLTVEPDVLLACDGIKSVVRTAVLKELGVSASVEDTGTAAYRIMLSREQMQHDPELLYLLESGRATRWMSDRRQIIAYPIAGKTVYNLSTTQPDTNFASCPNTTYTTRGSKEQMLRVFADFCPRVQKLLALVPAGNLCEWKIRIHAPLPTWVLGTTALVGDAAHPMLPHLAQGAAQAIEDGASLAEALAALTDPNPACIQLALQVYQDVRKARAEDMAGIAAASGKSIHLGEGVERDERDRQFAALKAGEQVPVPDRWLDTEVQKCIYGVDCVKEAKQRARAVFAAAA